MAKKALITGGAGFIGSHLADRLLTEGYTVTALDNMSTGSYSNIEHLKSHPRFELVVADVTDSEPLGELISDTDIIYHLAAAVGVRLVVENPLASMTTNIKGTESVLQQAIDAVDATYRLSINPDSVGQVCNIGGNAETSIMDLAFQIKRKTASNSEIRKISYEKAFAVDTFEDVPGRIPDLSKLDSFIGYKPNYSLDDIIDSVVKHIRQHPELV